MTDGILFVIFFNLLIIFNVNRKRKKKRTLIYKPYGSKCNEFNFTRHDRHCHSFIHNYLRADGQQYYDGLRFDIFEYEIMEKSEY